MTVSKPFDLDRLFEGSLRRLRAEAEYFSRLTDHDPELGRLNETHLVGLLRDYLPPKIGIGTGFIASGGDESRQSPQCDIILFDALKNVPLYKSDTWSIYPIEMVYGVIEVKTTINRSELRNAFEKCEKIRAMAKNKDGTPNKRYVLQIPPKLGEPARFELKQSDLPPRFYIFGYNGWKTKKGLEENFRLVSAEFMNAHVHGVCNLNVDGSLYMQHLAFRIDEDRFSAVSESGFRHFVTVLPSSLDSMLPVQRNGLGFDQIYLPHYNLDV